MVTLVTEPEETVKEREEPFVDASLDLILELLPSNLLRRVLRKSQDLPTLLTPEDSVPREPPESRNFLVFPRRTPRSSSRRTLSEELGLPPMESKDRRLPRSRDSLLRKDSEERGSRRKKRRTDG